MIISVFSWKRVKKIVVSAEENQRISLSKIEFGISKDIVLNFEFDENGGLVYCYQNAKLIQNSERVENVTIQGETQFAIHTEKGQELMILAEIQEEYRNAVAYLAASDDDQ